MTKSMDPILTLMVGLLLASLLAFFLGIIPYPYGLLVLGVFIAARILYLRSNRSR